MKIFKRSTIIKDGLMPSDYLGITSIVDKELNAVTAKVSNTSFTYIADNTFTEAYSILGRYTISGNTISVKVYLMQGAKEDSIYQFEISGELEKKEELARSIVEKVNEFLNQ